MNNNPKDATPSANPVADVKLEVANLANQWINEHPDTPVVLIFHQPITAVDPATGETFVEARGDLVEKGSWPLGEAPILEKIYSTKGFYARMVATPAEALGR